MGRSSRGSSCGAAARRAHWGLRSHFKKVTKQIRFFNRMPSSAVDGGRGERPAHLRTSLRARACPFKGHEARGVSNPAHADLDARMPCLNARVDVSGTIPSCPVQARSCRSRGALWAARRAVEKPCLGDHAPELILTLGCLQTAEKTLRCSQGTQVEPAPLGLTATGTVGTGLRLRPGQHRYRWPQDIDRSPRGIALAGLPQLDPNRGTVGQALQDTQLFGAVPIFIAVDFERAVAAVGVVVQIAFGTA